MDIRQVILKTMKATGTTQADLVRATGILPHRISEYLSGVHDMSGRNLGTVLGALGLELRAKRGRKG